MFMYAYFAVCVCTDLVDCVTDLVDCVTDLVDFTLMVRVVLKCAFA